MTEHSSPARTTEPTAGDRAARPRVGVNLLWCLPGDVGGTEQYLVRQLVGLLEVAGIGGPAGQLEVTLFATPEFREAHGSVLSGCTFVDSPHDGENRLRRVVDENTWLYSRTAGFDLVHQAGGTAPMRARRPFVLTIHDLQYRTFPQHFSAVKRRYLDAVIPSSVRRAAAIVVPSDYVRRSVVTGLGVAESRVTVVPHGHEPTLLVERTSEADLRQKFALGENRVLLYPAMTAPHKRHTFLIELMQRHWTDHDLRLVLIGGKGRAENDVARAIADSPREVRDRIVRPGRVSDSDRNGLLAMAEVMVFPSEYEGFGAPVVEAMAVGTPVLCSDATCLPDVAGDAAVVRPLTFDAWADALSEVAKRRHQLVSAGLARAHHFSTRVAGRALLDAYRAALGQ
jgi:glycosyltransferase involved in cell wall biosynthesis